MLASNLLRPKLRTLSVHSVFGGATLVNYNANPPAAAGTGGFSGAQALSTPGYYYPYFSSSAATAPISPAATAVGLGSAGAYDGSLHCPGQANENASILKYFTMGGPVSALDARGIL